MPAVARTWFVGSRYEEVVCATGPGERRQHLGSACLAGLTADITARGHTATRICSRDDRASRLLAWTGGFRLVREYMDHTAGSLPVSGASNLSATA